jgi:hypothetical protein
VPQDGYDAKPQFKREPQKAPDASGDMCSASIIRWPMDAHWKTLTRVCPQALTRLRATAFNAARLFLFRKRCS